MTFVEHEAPPLTVRFRPGTILMTPGAAAAMKRAGQKPSEFVYRHITLDRGELSVNDHRENVSAMKTGLRILSHYKTALSDELWLITEWVDMKARGADAKKRELTTILLPEEY